METIYTQAQQTILFLETKFTIKPTIGIVLGTGLGKLVEEVEDPIHIPYRNIPHFPVSTTESHAGELIVGKLEGKNVMILSGRFHFYEGYSTKEVTYPIRVMQLLGITHLLITNAAGGLNPEYNAGDIVLVKDHINLMPDHPLRGFNEDKFGVRFPDMLHAYDPEMQSIAKAAFKSLDVPFKTGVYVGLQGPSLETPAEYTFLHRIGGDLVGMSTVPEVIVAHHGGMKVGVLSTVSNVCYPLERLQETTLESVIETVQVATPTLQSIIKEILSKM